jgi:protein kinase A
VKIAKKENGQGLVAIKSLKKFELIKNKQVDHVHSEITIMSQLNHPLLTKLCGMTQDEKYIYIIMEFIQGGEFFLYLRNEDRFTAPVAS